VGVQLPSRALCTCCILLDMGKIGSLLTALLSFAAAATGLVFYARKKRSIEIGDALPICPQCQQRPVHGPRATYCDECIKINAARRAREKYARLKQIGSCTKCRNEVFKGGLCFEHYMAHTAKQTEKETALVSQGLCKISGCGQAIFKWNMCLKHYKVNLIAAQKRRDEKREKGSCLYCNRPIYFGGLCEQHHLRDIAGKPLCMDVSCPFVIAGIVHAVHKHRFAVCQEEGCTQEGVHLIHRRKVHRLAVIAGKPQMVEHLLPRTSTSQSQELCWCGESVYKEHLCEKHFQASESIRAVRSQIDAPMTDDDDDDVM
jgi:hypothetical protein